MEDLYIVFGGSGYLGSNLIYYLKTLNKNIINIDIKPNDLVYTLGYDISKNEAISFIVSGIKCFGLAEYNYIFINLAANSFVNNSLNNPIKVYENNINICINIAKIVNYFTNYKFIHISSDEVNNKYIKSLSEYSTSSLSKMHSEELFINLIENVKIVRLCNLYGIIDKDKSLIQQNDCIINILIQKPNIVYIDGEGKQERIFIHIRDCIKYLIKIINNEEIENKNIISTIDDKEIYNLAFANEAFVVCIRDLIKYVRISDKEDYEYRKDIRGKYQDKKYGTSCNIKHGGIIERRIKLDSSTGNLEKIYKEILRIRNVKNGKFK